jgi:hypothetical protein
MRTVATSGWSSVGAARMRIRWSTYGTTVVPFLRDHDRPVKTE